jgi:peptidoglycan/xylan/chitin deacetylase (PgdA/CDA1 family)
MLNPVPVLYHAVATDPPSWIAPFTVSPATFSAHLDAVTSSDRQPLTVSGYAHGLCGKAALPPQPVVITVDDGFADFALPALAGRNLLSTLYVTTGALADMENECVLPAADMLCSADLRGLEAVGAELGAHSHTHPQLDLLSERVVAAELSRSGALSNEMLGHRIPSFVCPHGCWSVRIRRLVAEAGFDSSCAVGEALSSARDHLLTISRLHGPN